MPDEALTDFRDDLNLLIEGHHWLLEHLGVSVTEGWSIDPFGHSPTISYILHHSGIRFSVIDRVHYYVKRMLVENQTLEFQWKQMWTNDDEENGAFNGKPPLTHMLAKAIYTFPDQCGENKFMCETYDVVKKNLNLTNLDLLKTHANALTKQFRKKSMMYRHKYVLVPYGNDFAFMNRSEAFLLPSQMSTLFNYINSHESYEMKIKFSTLKTYFNEVLKAIEPLSFRTVSGDFFPYCDYEVQYWNGFYSSRPSQKSLVRKLQRYIFGIDVWFSQFLASMTKESNREHKSKMRIVFLSLKEARRELFINQHHDAITGTSKPHVMENYEERLLLAFDNARLAVSLILDMQYISREDDTKPLPYLRPTNAEYLMNKLLNSPRQVNMETVKLSNAEKSFIKMDPTVLILKKNSLISFIVFNPLNIACTKLIELVTEHPCLTVRYAEGRKYKIPHQITPLIFHQTFEFPLKSALGVRVLIFLQAFGTARVEATSIPQCDSYNLGVISKLKSFGSISGGMPPPSYFQETLFENEETFLFHGHNNFAAKFCATEIQKDKPKMFHLCGIKHSGSDLFEVTADIMREQDVNGGAYIRGYANDKEWPEYEASGWIVTGSLISYVYIHYFGVTYRFGVCHYDSPECETLQVQVTVLIDRPTFETNEVFLRIQTGLRECENNHQLVWYTDLNGFQFTERRSFPNLPSMAEVVPMTAAAFMEDCCVSNSKDTKNRFTILSKEPHAIWAKKDSEMRIYLDRRMPKDDGKGLEEGIKDNKEFNNDFLLIWEKSKIQLPCEQASTEQFNRPKSVPTLSSLASVLNIWYQSEFLKAPLNTDAIVRTNPLPSTKSNDVSSCHNFITILRPIAIEQYDNHNVIEMTLKNVIFVVHKRSIDCSFPSEQITHLCSTNLSHSLSINEILPILSINEVSHTSLSGTSVYKKYSVNSSLPLSLGHASTFTITLNNQN